MLVCWCGYPREEEEISCNPPAPHYTHTLMVGAGSQQDITADTISPAGPRPGWGVSVGHASALTASGRSPASAQGSKVSLAWPLTALFLILQPEPNPGDLIEIFRPLYRHWAVYVGDGFVVHLAPPSKDAGPPLCGRGLRCAGRGLCCAGRGRGGGCCGHGDPDALFAA